MTKRLGIAWLLAALIVPQALAASPAESKRMERAKDLIADEQWVRAIDELRAAASDPKEPNKDEALFWLAHSENQARDSKAAIETISRLEQQFPASRWVKPARSLMIEIAQQLHRSDVLWYTAAPPPPPPTPATGAAPPALATPAPPVPRDPAAPRASLPAPPPRPGMPAPPPAPAATPGVPPPPMWIPNGFLPDTDLRIQALGSLMRTDAVRVIPMLKEIALEGDAREARRALFVLAQSGRADARSTVVDVAKTGPEPVQIAAVRELGRLGGATAATDLLQVYSSANERVKYQVVTSLARRDAAPALMRIAESEKDRRLRDVAIVTLGDAGGRTQLYTLYSTAPQDAKRAIVIGLFNAKAEDELIRIADREGDARIRDEAISRLRLLGTPKARAYLEAHR